MKKSKIIEGITHLRKTSQFKSSLVLAHQGIISVLGISPKQIRQLLDQSHLQKYYSNRDLRIKLDMTLSPKKKKKEGEPEPLTSNSINSMTTL